MNNRKLYLAMFAAATGIAVPSVSFAGVKASTMTEVLTASPTDKAPVTNTTPARLRRTKDDEPGNEMCHVAFFAGNKAGQMFCMTTDLAYIDPTTATVKSMGLAPDRVQLSLVPFHLAQNADGSVQAVADMTGAKFVTNNQGNEYRNANAPTAFTINNGTVIVATYNYQPNNTNNTQRYAMAFSATGTVLMPQTLIYAKTNDDCSMHQDESADTVAKVVAADTYVDTWNGCNGNGQDDGWFTRYKYSVDNAAAPTKVTVTQMVDVSLCPREERSRGKCSVGTDPDTVVCTWTEGNNQPQRDGVWIAAVDASGAKTGQAAILWKQQIGGKKLLPNGTSTYAQRAMHDRIPTVDPATGAMVPSDQIFFRYGDAYGNNNGNAKGGAYLYNNMGVIEAKASGMTYVVPMTDMTEKLIGLDGTHLGMATALFGTTDNLQPGIVFLGGSHTGGGYSAQMRAVGWDKTANTFSDLGMYGIAPHDRHLYSNYLGNNPGNQGRNHSGSVLIQNPFLGQNGTAADDTTKNTDAYLMVFTTSGKSTTTVTDASLKLSAFISIVPVAQTAASGTGTGSGTGGGDGTGGGGGGGTAPTDGSTELGGCSTSGGAGGAMGFLLIGLATFIRRRK